MSTSDPIAAADAILGGIRPQTVDTRHGPVECAVEGEGPAVLALHGAMGGCDQSVLLARAVAGPGWRTVAVSRPGYLGTPIAAGRTPEQQADRFADLLDALGIAEAAVLAVSGGGLNALQFALRHPRRCRGLVLLSACSARLRTPIPLRVHLMRAVAGWAPVGRRLGAMARRRIAGDPDAAAARSIPDPALRRHTLADPEAGPLFMALLLSTAERLSERMAGTSNDIAQSRRPVDIPVARIACPTLVVHGSADELVPVADARRLAAAVPGAELMEIEGGRHVALFTHRDAVRRRVAGFLEACSG